MDSADSRPSGESEPRWNKGIWGLAFLTVAAFLALSTAANPVAAQDAAPTETGQGVVRPPWPQSACDGEVPIVVASDAAAQSDIYSAVTLAGVLGTDCIVLAGPREGPIPSDEVVRLDNALPAGWIVGGVNAVPEWKTAGRTMQRIAGSDRWHTAREVGAVAANPSSNN